MDDIKKITTTFSSTLDKVGAFSSQTANYDVLYLDDTIDTSSKNTTNSLFGDFLEGTKAKISSWGSKIVSITSEVTENAVNFIDEACTNISSNVKSVIDDVSDWASETKSSVENWASDVGSAISIGAQNLWTNANSWWNASALPWIETAASTVWGVTKSVGATIAVGVQSLFEGVGEFGEAIVDFGALVGTGVASIVTGLIDGGQAIYGAVTGNEWSSVTKRMWGGTMGFVSTKYVSGWFDALYDKTAYGRWLKDNAYGFDTVRAVGSGIGYVAGVVALTIATFGAGGAVAAGGAVSATTAAAATSAAQMAVTAAAAGIGKGTQDAWADGADLTEGLAAGALNGIWEGLQFYIGGKISGLNLFGANGIVSSVGSSGVGTNILNSLARVVLDGVDGGLEGFVMPLLSTIYKDGYYDENGTYVEFFDKDNIFERYAEVFDDNGGWNTVLTQAAIGSASSLIGETFDLRKYFKSAEDPTTITLKLEDPTTITLKLEDPTTITLELDPKTSISMQEKAMALFAFQSEMAKGGQSNPQAISLMYKTFSDAIDNGNTDALAVLKMLTEVKRKNPELKIVTGVNASEAFWDFSTSSIVIGTNYLKWENSGTLTHELGHCLFDSILGGNLPSNWDDIAARARVISSNNVPLSYFQKTLENIDSNNGSKAKKEFERQLKQTSGLSLNKYKSQLTDQYQAMLDNMQPDELNIKLKQMGISDEVIAQISDGTIASKELATFDINNDIRTIKDRISRTQFNYTVSISDMIDALYLGTGKDLKGNAINLTYKHGGKYYNNTATNLPFHEIIANFTNLKLSEPSALGIVKSIFGEEFYNQLEEVFSKFML